MPVGRRQIFYFGHPRLYFSFSFHLFFLFHGVVLLCRVYFAICSRQVVPTTVKAARFFSNPSLLFAFRKRFLLLEYNNSYFPPSAKTLLSLHNWFQLFLHFFVDNSTKELFSLWKPPISCSFLIVAFAPFCSGDIFYKLKIISKWAISSL